MILDARLIFVHVPKTGGQSVARALGGKTAGVSTHAPLRCVERGDRFAFGFVRNPWSRMVSLYRFLCQKPFRRTDNFDQARVRAVGFKVWLTEGEFLMQEDDRPEGEPWIMPAFWKGDGGASLPPMQRRPQMWWLKGCDFIGRFERLEDDFRRALRAVDRTPPALGHVNRTEGGDWRREYDDASAAFIAEHFAADIDLFGYRGP